MAIDSVGFDFLRNEPRCTQVIGRPENYLHEMAQADSPPSGTFYDPERDGTPLESLGVHEHWNNAVEKQYSRNLGIGQGIELVVPSLASEDGLVQYWLPDSCQGGSLQGLFVWTLAVGGEALPNKSLAEHFRSINCTQRRCLRPCRRL